MFVGLVVRIANWQNLKTSFLARNQFKARAERNAITRGREAAVTVRTRRRLTRGREAAVTVRSRHVHSPVDEKRR